MSNFERPPIARQHCRHYEYEHGLQGGPRCAAGVDNRAPGFNTLAHCCPDPKSACSSREEWSDEERATWEAWSEKSRARLIAAIAALPRPIPMRTSGTVDCPSCDGKISYSRWYRGAGLECSTPMCCAALFDLAEPNDWPAGKGDE